MQYIIIQLKLRCVSPDKWYKVNGVYQMLTEAEPNNQQELHEIIWKKTVSLKVSIFPGINSR